MRLSDLIGGEGVTVVQGRAAETVEITGLAADSREVRRGYLFAALPGAAPGAKDDGRAYIEDALRHGAAAILAPAGTALPPALARGAPPAPGLPAPGEIPLITDPEPRRRFALMAARFHARQPEYVAAVTGTNGKTSVVCFARQLWAAMGLEAASLGTLGLTAPGREEPGGLTTPDPVRLHALLDRLARDGVSHVAMEASSHGIEQCRLDGVRLTAAAFTNLSRDHLDYHGTDAAYFAAKARLFSTLLPADGIAVLNADSPQFAALAAIARERGQRIVAYGTTGADIRIAETRAHGLGQDLTLEIFGRPRRLRLPLVGPFQAMNAACALGLVIACGGAAETAIAALERLGGVPGRLELVARRANGAAVFVDYAHTPDALAHVLAALRPHTAGRLTVVFGCGGDRDRGKRAEMGAIAASRADRVIVTDDNPRPEDPAAIRAAIVEGARGAAELMEIGDRRDAIRAALAALAPGDVAVIAGKGHERGQIVGDRVLPFVDADEVRAALADIDGRP